MDDTATSSPAGAGPAGTFSRRRFLAATGGGLAAVASACTGGQRRHPPTTAGVSATTTTAPVASLRIGYITEVNGPNAFRGEMVTASLDALQGYLDDKLGGHYRGIKPELIPADASSGAHGPAAYAELVGRHVDAILWCTPFGLPETAPAILAGGVPVISVFADAVSTGLPGGAALTGTAAKGSTLFQLALPESFAIERMLAYASEDRGFTTAGLIVDRAAYPHVEAMFPAAAAGHAMTNVGVFVVDTGAGHLDLGAPLQALKKVGAHVLLCYAYADAASIVATQLDTLDAKYLDTPTTLRSHFKPMMMGPVWGTGDPLFAGLAGAVAARGTLSATSLANVMTLPTWPMRKWMRDYVPRYNNGTLRGGENAPADAVGLLMDAAVRAGSTKGNALVAALESTPFTTLASNVDVSFSGARHLAVSADDTALLTLEHPPDPYDLGNEWKEVLPDGYQGPTHLVDFTLAANTRAHPQVVADILQHRYGTSATDSYQNGDPAKVAACKAVH